MDFEHADALNQAIRLLSLRHRARAATLLAPLGLHPGQEVLLLELARTGPMIQAQLSEALGCEPPSVTLMTRKLEATGHIRRRPAPPTSAPASSNSPTAAARWPTGSSSCGALWRRRP
nr:hypothetical protein GCM10020093_005710 [Planobispora longispora]